MMKKWSIVENSRGSTTYDAQIYASSMAYPLTNVMLHDNSPTSQNPQAKANHNLNTSPYCDLYIPHMCLRTMLAQPGSGKTPYATLRQPGFCIRQMFIRQGPN